MKTELEVLKRQNENICVSRTEESDSRSLLNVNGHLRVRRRRRSSSGLARTCCTCNKLIDNNESKSADESETIRERPDLCESKSWSGSAKDKSACKHHSLKKRFFLHSNSSPNLLNKGSRKETMEEIPSNVKRLSMVSDIPEINVKDMSETEKTDNEMSTLNVLENILALESDTGLSEMDDDNSDKSSDEDNDI